MNSILFGAITLGLISVAMTRDPQEVAALADDMEVARLMEQAPDEGSFTPTTITDPETGEQIVVDVLAFRD